MYRGFADKKASENDAKNIGEPHQADGESGNIFKAFANNEENKVAFHNKYAGN